MWLVFSATFVVGTQIIFGNNFKASLSKKFREQLIGFFLGTIYIQAIKIIN